MLALQRGASNLYFPEVSSSILIPPYSSRIREVLAKAWARSVLESALEDGAIPDASFKAVAKIGKVDWQELNKPTRRCSRGPMRSRVLPTRPNIGMPSSWPSRASAATQTTC